MNKMSNLLKPDLNVECNIPFAPLNKIYIRTGVHGDGSCFYHSFLRITSPSYRYLNYEDRCKLVAKLREQLASQVSNESLMNLGNGESRRMLFFQILSARIEAGFPSDPRGIILNKLIHLTTILEETTTFESNFYLLFLEKIELAVRAKIGEKYVKFDSYIKNWLYPLFKAVNEQVIENFKNKLLSDQVSAVEIEFISRCLNYNFFFLRDVQGICEKYPTGMQVNEEWPCVVFLWIDDCHYEIIGEMQHNRIVRRQFEYKNSLIQAIVC